MKLVLLKFSIAFLTSDPVPHPVSGQILASFNIVFIIFIVSSWNS